MRSIPATMQKKLASRVQAGSSALGTSLWVGRPTTPLTEDKFLEKQTILSSSEITKTSIAVCHPRLMRGATEVYIGYIEAGTAKITKSLYVEDMPRHIWVDTKFSEWADDISVCFDGTMIKSSNGWVEFKTELSPWVFWTRSGALYGQKLGDSGNPLTLAEANCTAVSAVRAMWSSSGGFDFGLVVFFVVEGALYYRQLISGEWMDAEIVSFGPQGVLWEDIATFRTWDYRVGLQCKSTDGKYYELFTQFMGIGKQTSEHIEVRSMEVKEQLSKINYIDSRTPREHVGLSMSAKSELTYGLSSVPLEVYNVDDGTGNYGILLNIRLDYPVSNVEGNHPNFTLVDSNSVAYLCTSSSVDSSGCVIQLTFSDFNLAEGATLTLTYTPGSIQSPAAPLNAFELNFMGTNLEAPAIPVPEPIAAWNVDSDGTEIALQFSQKLTGDISGTQTPVGYVRKSFDLSGATITTLNQYSSSYPGTKVIDGDTSTYWRGTTISNWIQFALPEAKIVTGLRIYLGSYYVSKFTFQGSNDGTTWTQIGGTYSAASSTTKQWYEFSINNTESYLYYRINTTSGYSSSRVYVYEVELQEDIPAGNELRTRITGLSYSYVPGGTLESASRLVTAVTADEEDATILYLSLAPGMGNNLQNLHGDVEIRYAGGTLRGQGGPIADFEFTFTPVDLSVKNNPNVEEHIDLSLIEVNSRFEQVFYTETHNKEHINISTAVEAALVHVDDL